ncbi:hypothetical protein XELAEV_18017955mg [Xenopus laevis]|uniref:C-type lectin domain-containing protein n=1 Tax=Xenopus laevis TaxID=8355 RepID=A0A974DC40_XENLA|nr:hypothetical protein XELAEV_18017955mg [Xenopus laevis]
MFIIILSCFIIFTSSSVLLSCVILRVSLSDGEYGREGGRSGGQNFKCVSYGYGAHLASIFDNSEADIIASHVFAYPANGDNLRWKWNYGSMYNYRNWKNGEPNNINNEYCGELAVETKFISWNDAPCCTQNHFMCKFKT